jgi:hypothetical protein
VVRSAHDGIMTLEAAGAIQVSTVRETTCISDRRADTGTAARLRVKQVVKRCSVTLIVLCAQLSACAQPPVEGPPIGEVEPACQQAMQKAPDLDRLLQLPGGYGHPPISVPLGELRFHDREFVRVAGVAAVRDRRLALYSSLDARVPMVQLTPYQLWNLWPDVDAWDRDVSA